MAPYPYPLSSFYTSSRMICLNSLFQMTRALIKKKNSPHLKGLVCRTLPSFSLEVRSSSRLY